MRETIRLQNSRFIVQNTNRGRYTHRRACKEPKSKTSHIIKEKTESLVATELMDLESLSLQATPAAHLQK